MECDVTNPGSVRAAFDAVVSAFGGVDIVVSNAGAAWQGTIGTVDDATLRKSFELNFWAHQSVAQNAVRIMQAQGTYGCLLFNTSKQAVNPGKDFGPYGLPKAATLFLVKQYALDVTAFLQWAAEPKLEQRKMIGFRVILFLIVFATLLYYTKKKIWADAH